MTKKPTKQERAFIRSFANGSSAASAYAAAFKADRLRPETIDRRAAEVMARPRVAKLIPRAKRDAALVREYHVKNRDLMPRPAIKQVDGQDGTLAPAGEDDVFPALDVFAAAAAKAFGTADQAFMATIANMAMRMIPTVDDPDVMMINGIFSAVAGIGPRDEVEGMLALQMVAVHFATIEATRRAAIPDQTFEARNMNLKHAGQLARTFTMQMDALKRNRQKAQQTVRVERVYVNEGGQAIVGNVQRGGAQQKAEGQSHEQDAVTHAPVTPMRSEEPSRETVPVASDA